MYTLDTYSDLIRKGIWMVALAQVQNQPLGDSERKAQRPIDLVHLARQSLGDPGLEEEILRMFEQIVSTYMARVREGAQVEDVSFSLHALRGAAGGVGATSIAALATEAEAELTPEGHLGAERVADLGLAVEEVRTFIAELLDE